MPPDDEPPVIGSTDDANRVLVEEAELKRLPGAEEFPERSECIFAEIFGDMAGL